LFLQPFIVDRGHQRGFLVFQLSVFGPEPLLLEPELSYLLGEHAIGLNLSLELLLVVDQRLLCQRQLLVQVLVHLQVFHDRRRLESFLGEFSLAVEHGKKVVLDHLRGYLWGNQGLCQRTGDCWID
jgi:hypothetical protein